MHQGLGLGLGLGPTPEPEPKPDPTPTPDPDPTPEQVLPLCTKRRIQADYRALDGATLSAADGSVTLLLYSRLLALLLKLASAGSAEPAEIARRTKEVLDPPMLGLGLGVGLRVRGSRPSCGDARSTYSAHYAQ